MRIFQVSECVRHEKILEELQKMFAYLQVSLFCLVPLLPEWVFIASSVFFVLLDTKHACMSVCVPFWSEKLWIISDRIHQ